MGTLRDHLEAVKRITGTTPPELLQAGPCPQSLLTAWPIFQVLSSTRSYGEGGTPLPIRHGEILAWSTLYERKLLPSTLRVIRMLDTAWIKAARQRG
jgi:hypothetical protein